MKAALADLDELHRVPLKLYYFEELSQKAIAARLGIPVGTVMSRLSRGRHLMRRNMERKRRSE
jgi:RNA polymerase sigma-70 factor (ECF subfamily)